MTYLEELAKREIQDELNEAAEAAAKEAKAAEEAEKETKEEIVQTPVVPHTHSYTGTVTTEAGCETDGVKTFTCACGDSYTQTIAATGHNYGTWTVHTPATIAAAGQERRVCPCGAYQTRSIPQLNELYSTDNTYTPNDATIKPRHLYWEGDVLVAECYVINGYDFTIFDINVENLTFSNADGVFASAAFGVLPDVVLPSHTCQIVTFRFGGSAVQNANASLLGEVFYHSDLSGNC